ncbi:hypothetical protein Bbelb_168120 [Branchiostoma belcheri]|nr:hypothetical protein Bbelb_168120 [Branchiostoma belcheri]
MEEEASLNRAIGAGISRALDANVPLPNAVKAISPNCNYYRVSDIKDRPSHWTSAPQKRSLILPSPRLRVKSCRLQSREMRRETPSRCGTCPGARNDVAPPSARGLACSLATVLHRLT